ncbi:PIR protein [Plasmodium vivax]|uniref:VIR protein n=1 Tax=Plasmodium vivax TaxID=5855 RepID=A0A565A3M2_PLAVI|nr:PIR protein [Plasmodium vivax]
MDIEDFLNNYSFLSNMVIAYKEFNETVTEEQRSLIKSLMDNLRGSGEYNHKHKDIYEKVMRNLSLLLSKTHTKTQFSDYCTYLYQWLGKYQCPYYTYDKNYDDPIKIIKLQIFDLNINIIEQLLMNENYSNNLPFQKYICECVNIFNEMYNENYPCTEDKNEKHKHTCDFLNKFRYIYMSYLYNKEGIKDKIPSLNSSEVEFLALCPLYKQETVSQLVTETSPKPESAPVSESEGSSVSVEQSGKPIPFNTTSVVSAMAGKPPFLALIYKFTPVGNMFRRKNNKSANVINNLDEEIEKELFYRRLENGTIKSSPATYNVAYGSV